MSVGDASAKIVLEPLRHVTGLGANLEALSTQQRETLVIFRSQVELTEEAQTLADYLTDAVLVRFLIARDWDTDKALKMALGALQWRLKRMCHTWSLARDFIGIVEASDSSKHSVDAPSPTAVEANKAREVALRENATTGKIRVAPKPDKHGRPVMILDNSRENCNDANAMIEYLAFNMELCMRTAFVHRLPGKPLADKIMLVMHMSDFSIFNQPPMAVTKETITILGTAFPESLGTAVILNPPIYFTSFWALVSPLLDPKTRDKVYMLRGSMANGSPNDAIMCELIGDNWKELTGCDLGILSQGYSSKHRKLIDASPGFVHSSYWPTVLERESAYRDAQVSGAVLAAATLSSASSSLISQCDGAAILSLAEQDPNSDSPTSAAAVDGEVGKALPKHTITAAVPQPAVAPPPVKGWRRMSRALSFSSNSRSNRRATIVASSSRATNSSAWGLDNEVEQTTAAQMSARSRTEPAAAITSNDKTQSGADLKSNFAASPGSQHKEASEESALVRHEYDVEHRIALDVLAVVLCAPAFFWLLESCPQFWAIARTMGSAPARAWIKVTTGIWLEEVSGPDSTAAAAVVNSYDAPSVVRVASAIGELSAVLTVMLAISHAAAAFASAASSRDASHCSVSPPGSLSAGSAAKPQRVRTFLRGCRRGMIMLLQVFLLATFFALMVASFGAPKDNRGNTCGPYGNHRERSSCVDGAGSVSGSRSPAIISTDGALSYDGDPEVQYLEIAVSMARLWAPRFVCASSAAQVYIILG